MNRKRSDVGQALRDALVHAPSDGAQTRHLTAIRAALSAAGPATTGATTDGWSWRTTAARRRLVAGTAVIGLAVPGVAVAADDALPGEALYPIKRVVESVRTVFDPEVAARHRLEELEAILGRTADAEEVEEATQRARDAVADHDSAELDARLDELSAQVDLLHGDDEDPDSTATTDAEPTEPDDEGSEGPTEDPDGGADDDDRDDPEGTATDADDDHADEPDDEPDAHETTDEHDGDDDHADEPDDDATEAPNGAASEEPDDHEPSDGETPGDGTESPDDEPTDEAEEPTDEPSDDATDAPDVSDDERAEEDAAAPSDDATPSDEPTDEASDDPSDEPTDDPAGETTAEPDDPAEHG